MRPRWLHIIMFLATVTLCGSCQKLFTPPLASRNHVDSLCARALAYRYVCVDSVAAIATEALREAQAVGYDDGCAEAMLCIAAERFQQMDFDSTLALAATVHTTTDNQVLRLHADVMQMRVAQRTSRSLDFFLHRHHAAQREARILEEADFLSPHLAQLFATARGDMHIVASTYFYYASQQERAIDEIRAAEPYCQLPADTANWLYYCYMRGSGGLSEYTETQAVARDEFDYLFRAYTLAKNHGYTFFEANSLQSLSTLFADSLRLSAVRDYKPHAVDYLLGIFGTDTTAQAMAQRALSLFRTYDDLYQMACALRTLGELAFGEGRYADAVQCYAQALDCVNFHHSCYYASSTLLDGHADSDLLAPYVPGDADMSVERRWMQAEEVKTVPEWIAGIRQQLSVAYSAMNMKAESDYNRNIYVDLLDVTREDAEIHSRAIMLSRAKRQMRWSLVAVVVFAVVVVAIGMLLRRLWWRRVNRRIASLQHERELMTIEVQQRQQLIADEQERLAEERHVLLQRIRRDKRDNLERHAKLQLVQGLLPFIDRVSHEVRIMQRNHKVDADRLVYISELIAHIEHLNALLTAWVQMQQGRLSLHITSFPLQPLLDSLSRNSYVYGLKQLTLDVKPTALSVKADRSLTMFMLNTLADNARKFTPEGGHITISAAEGMSADAPYVELSVADTGCGLTEEEVAMIVGNKVYDASSIGKNNPSLLHPDATDAAADVAVGKGSGFGLMNCKGIIETYRKTSALFSVCTFGIESRVGEGSRFFFRLPRVLTLMAILLLASSSQAATTSVAALVDSVRSCNASAHYAEAIDCAAEALHAIHPQLQLLDTASIDATTAADLALYRQGAAVDYVAIIALRGEVATAALALHRWPLYRYNNHLFTRLYKLTNQDTSLEAYCQQTQRAEEAERVAMVLVVLLLLLGCVVAYVFYLRPQLSLYKATAEGRRRDYDRWLEAQDDAYAHAKSELEEEADEQRRRQYEDTRLHVQNQIIDNCLSTIKHETMYFPSRMSRLVTMLSVPEADTDQPHLLQALGETVAYYSSLFTILSQQAMQQSASVHFRRATITAEAIAQMAAAVGITTAAHDAALSVRGDDELLALLLESVVRGERELCAERGVELPPIVLHLAAEGSFVRLELHVEGLSLADDEAAMLFVPRDRDLDFLLCRQIVREHDTFFAHVGCRAEAHPSAEGHTILFTLPIARDNAKPATTSYTYI